MNDFKYNIKDIVEYENRKYKIEKRRYTEYINISENPTKKEMSMIAKEYFLENLNKWVIEHGLK